MFEKEFWLDTAERVISTMAQTFVALIGVDATRLADIPWGTTGLAVLFAGLLSLVKCLAASRVGSPESAALLPEADTVDPLKLSKVDEYNVHVDSTIPDETPQGQYQDITTPGGEKNVQ